MALSSGSIGRERRRRLAPDWLSGTKPPVDGNHQPQPDTAAEVSSGYVAGPVGSKINSRNPDSGNQQCQQGQENCAEGAWFQMKPEEEQQEAKEYNVEKDMTRWKAFVVEMAKNANKVAGWPRPVAQLL